MTFPWTCTFMPGWLDDLNSWQQAVQQSWATSIQLVVPGSGLVFGKLSAGHQQNLFYHSRLGIHR